MTMLEAPDGDDPKIKLSQETIDYIARSQYNGINGYRCDKCQSIMWVKHVAKGVTPMYLKCRSRVGCPGTGISLMYRVPVLLNAPVKWEWYRPNQREYDGLSTSMKDHVNRGGLMIREIKA